MLYATMLLEGAPFAISWSPKVESKKPLKGIEPLTYRLRSDCSTVELQWRGLDYTKHLCKQASVQVGR